MTGGPKPDGHASPQLLVQYADGVDLGADVVWALETHFERCADCRGQLAVAVHRDAPDTDALLDRVLVGLDAGVAHSSQSPVRRRWRSPLTARWAPPSLLPWLTMTVLAVVIAVGFDALAAGTAGHPPSLLLLLAPVAPLLGVAAAWSQGRDPAYEIVAATPRSGLELVLRRTLAVLLVVMPALALGGLVVGASPVRWLLPCLAFALGDLALGAVIGVARAAVALGLVWTAVVVAPSLVTTELSVVLAPAAMPGWAVAATALAGALLVQRRALTRLPSGR